MPDPIVFTSHNRVKEGKLDAFRQFFQQGTPALEADKPATVFFNAYLNEEGTQVNIVHIFPDAAAMDAHMEGAAERSRAAFEFIESMGLEIYGNPSSEALAMMRQASGVDVIVSPQSLGGFIRLR